MRPAGHRGRCRFDSFLIEVKRKASGNAVGGGPLQDQVMQGRGSLLFHIKVKAGGAVADPKGVGFIVKLPNVGEL